MEMKNSQVSRRLFFSYVYLISGSVDSTGPCGKGSKKAGNVPTFKTKKDEKWSFEY